MFVYIDGKRFAAEKVERERAERQYAETSAAGLDGVVSVDLGMRVGRLIIKGVLRGAAKSGLDEAAAELYGFIDGGEHELQLWDGRYFSAVRIESLRTHETEHCGNSVRCDYELTCSLLRQV